MPNGHEVVDQMTAAGWVRTGDVTFAAHLETWADAREPLATAMNAALAPFLPYWLGAFDSAEHAAEADQQLVTKRRLIFDACAEESNRSGGTSEQTLSHQASRRHSPTASPIDSATIGNGTRPVSDRGRTPVSRGSGVRGLQHGTRCSAG